MRCQACGNIQAEQLKIRKITSFIIWFNTSTWNYPTCSMCAEGLYFDFQSTTLKAGWWGPTSFLFTIFNVPANYNAIQKHRSRLSTVDIEGETYPRPYLSALKDTGVRVVLLILAAVVIFALSAVNSSSSNSYSNNTPTNSNSNTSIIGSCWYVDGDFYQPVDCESYLSELHVGYTTSDPENCGTDWFEGDATESYDYACLIRD